MSPIDRISADLDALTAIRRDLHAHPELGFEEVRTSGIVAKNSRPGGSRSIAGSAAPASSAS